MNNEFVIPKDNALKRRIYLAFHYIKATKYAKGTSVWAVIAYTCGAMWLGFLLFTLVLFSYMGITSDLDKTCPDNFIWGSTECEINHQVKHDISIIDKQVAKQEQSVEDRLATSLGTDSHKETKIDTTTIAALISALKQDATKERKAELDSILKDVYNLQHLINLRTEKETILSEEGAYSPGMVTAVVGFIGFLILALLFMPFMDDAFPKARQRKREEVSKAKRKWRNKYEEKIANAVIEAKNTWSMSELQWLEAQHKKGNLDNLLKFITVKEQKELTHILKHTHSITAKDDTVRRLGKRELMLYIARNTPFPPAIVRRAYNGEIDLKDPSRILGSKTKRVPNPLSKSRV